MATPNVLNPMGGTLLLFLSEDQKRMLRRYGSTTCLDATYKINKWGYAFFIVAVVDEHRHAFPCAFFIVQHEKAECVGEALAYLKYLVPEWNPVTIIMDKDDSEINACQATFPRAILVLCEFHVKQAWLRWLRTSAHGVPKVLQKIIYDMLTDILKSPSAEQATHKGKIFEAYLERKHLSQCLTWWRREWRPSIHMWCSGFYAHLFTRGFSTNNYVEGLNFALKSML
eukprot:3829733-Pyramimonas_sp.AAC.1